jgi:predicted lipoprotein with Yx(FWY)xxD motif
VFLIIAKERRPSLMLKRMIPVTLLLVLSLLLAACGSSGSNSYGSSSGAGSTGGSTPTTAPTTSAPVIKTATATVKGASQTILTNAQGMTLYYFTPDTTTSSACTGGCATMWPPMQFQGSGTPIGATSLPGKLSAVSDGNGTQVEYNGHPLYTFSGDTAPGQTHGEGILGKWFVATSSLSVQGTQQTTPTTPTPAGRGGY